MKLKLNRRQGKWLLGISLGLIALLAPFTAYAFYYNHRFLPHTNVAGVALGGLTLDGARERLTQKEHQFSQVQLTYRDKSWSVKTADLDLQFQNETALGAAYAYGKSGNFGLQLRQLVGALVRPRYHEVILNPVSTTGREYLDKTVLGSIETQPAETTLQFIPGRVTIVPGKAGEKLDYNRLESDLYAAFKAGSATLPLQLVTFQPELTPAQAQVAQAQANQILAAAWTLTAPGQTLTLDPATLATWLGTGVARDETGRATALALTLKDGQIQKTLTDFAAKVAKKPSNALLKISNGTLSVSQDAQSGLSLDSGQTLAAVHQALLAATIASRSITAVTQVVMADVRTDTLASLGIKELIGSGTTDFGGSPNNRIYNITRGANSLTGQIVKDGDVFSTVNALGPIDESTGYLPELVILNNRTVPEAGGGLCQVSTTLFRAVLNAGLPVTDRTNHAYRVSYYEKGVGPGLDATIYDPQPDFKFKNDTGHAIYIQAYIHDGTLLTFELYGTKDGRVSHIDGPTLLATIPVGDPIMIPTDTMFKDEKKQVEIAHNGARTTATYTVTRDGQQINQQVFNSYYKPWPAQFLVGTKDRPS